MTGESQNFTSDGTVNSLASNNVKTLVHDESGNLWIGTVNGLNFFDTKANTFTTYRHENGNKNSLINNQIHALHIDDREILWTGTNGGGVQLFDIRRQEFT